MKTEALTLALEALENFKGCLPEHWETFDEQAITAIKEALAQPEAKTTVALYTTPPQRIWVGLTDKEAHELWESTDSDDDWELMKRTEAKLKEKNT